MNERIKELAEQAGINIDSFQFSGTPIKHIVDEPSLKKFAELIIAECCVALRPMLRDMISRSRGVDLIVEHFKGES